MRVIICPDSFKGSLSSVQAAEAIERGVRRGAAGIVTVKIPLADGGEGTVEALVRATGGETRRARVHDPLMREIDSFYGILGDGRTAVVEMAAASGLHLLFPEERNPLVTTTFGVGELLLAAAEAGVERITVGIGGSATNDGGAGAMAALGVRFLDEAGCDLPPGGAALAKLDRIDTSRLDFPTDRVTVEVACDVTNPLTGPTGASAVFGPQKGATPEMVRQLDGALANYAAVILRDLGVDIDQTAGAGAAGGLGAGLVAFLGAKTRSGIELVLDAVGFDEALTAAGLVITGEGRLDEQTAYGKAVGGVLGRASAAGVPVVALVGAMGGDITALYEAGLTAAFSIAPGPIPEDVALDKADQFLEALAANLARLWICAA